MNEEQETREPLTEEGDSEGSFRQWFALGALLFAWIAEATMCAERGF